MSARILLAAAVCATLASTLAAEPVSDGRVCMGTVLEVQIEGLPEDRARVLLDALYTEVEREERIFSSFDPESAISRLNASAGREPLEIPADLMRLLTESRELSTLSGDTFDVTVAPLVRLWKDAGARGRAPSDDEVAGARSRVGSRRLRIDAEHGRAALEAGSAIDVGGIAKGFALDRSAELLRAAEVRGALLSFGQSSIHAHGSPAGRAGWRIALRDARGGFAGVIELRDAALSVSESLGQRIEIEGARFGHVLDPRSGRPLEQPALAAVVSSSGTRAEALSKALLILGAREGIALLDRLPDVQGMLAEADGRLWFTRGFRAATRFEPWSGPQPPYATR